MKKKVFNESTTPIRTAVNKSGFFITCSPSGIIRISKELYDKLNSLGPRLNFVQDEDRPGDWYLQPSTHPEAFTLKTNKAGDYNQYVLQEILPLQANF